MVLLCFLTMGTVMVEKQPCCFPKVPAQQSMVRKKGHWDPLLCCLLLPGSCAQIQTWPEGGDDEGVGEEQPK